MNILRTKFSKRQNRVLNSTIHWAVETFQNELVDTLCDFGAISVVDLNGQSALHVAAIVGNSEAAALLINAGVHVDVMDGKGQTPLHLAVDFGQINLIQTLISCSANVDVVDWLGETALHHAITLQKTVRASLTADKGMAIQRHRNETLLYRPNSERLEETIKIIETLLAAGANANVLNNLGETALHRVIKKYYVGEKPIGCIEANVI